MPETLTPAETFDTGIQVPLGNELTRAAQLKAFAQKLLNRTEWLRNKVGVLDEDQTWIGVNLFDAAVAVLNTLTVKPDSGTAPGVFFDTASSSSSDWNYMCEFRTVGSTRVRVYTGVDGVAVGCFAIVYNAVWSGTQWSLVDSTKKCVALIWRNDNVRLVGKPAASAPWASFPQNTLQQFGSTLQSEVMQGGRMLAVANTDTDRTNGYRYPAAVERWSPIPLGSCWGNILINAAGHIQRNVGVSSEYDQIWFPIRVPTYCSFRTVKVHFHQLQSGDSSHPDQFQLMRRQAAGAWETVGAVETHGSFGDTIAILHGSDAQEVLEQFEWAYRWKVVSTDLAVSLNRIVGLEVQWFDIGPNNRIG